MPRDNLLVITVVLKNTQSWDSNFFLWDLVKLNHLMISVASRLVISSAKFAVCMGLRLGVYFEAVLGGFVGKNVLFEAPVIFKIGFKLSAIDDL